MCLSYEPGSEHLHTRKGREEKMSEGPDYPGREQHLNLCSTFFPSLSSFQNLGFLKIYHSPSLLISYCICACQRIAFKTLGGII
jgi:hypothetical protein